MTSNGAQFRFCCCLAPLWDSLSFAHSLSQPVTGVTVSILFCPKTNKFSFVQNILINTNILLSRCCIFYMFLLKLRLINEFLLDYDYMADFPDISLNVSLSVCLFVPLIFIIIIYTFFHWRVSCFGQTPDRGFCTINEGRFFEFY